MPPPAPRRRASRTAACVASFLSDRLLPRAKCEPAPRALRGLLNEPTVRARLGKERAALRTLFLQIATTLRMPETTTAALPATTAPTPTLPKRTPKPTPTATPAAARTAAARRACSPCLGGGKQTPRPEAGGDGEAGGEAPSLSARLAALQEASAPAPAPVQDQNDGVVVTLGAWLSLVARVWAPAEVVQPSDITGVPRVKARWRVGIAPERALAAYIAARRVDAPTKRAGLDFYGFLRAVSLGGDEAYYELEARPAAGAAAGRWPHDERKGVEPVALSHVALRCMRVAERIDAAVENVLGRETAAASVRRYAGVKAPPRYDGAAARAEWGSIGFSPKEGAVAPPPPRHVECWLSCWGALRLEVVHAWPTWEAPLFAYLRPHFGMLRQLFSLYALPPRLSEASLLASHHPDAEELSMGRVAWEVLVQDLRDVLLASELPAELPAHLAAPLASGADAPVGSLVGATLLGGPLAPDATIAELSLCDFVSALIALGFFIANGRGFFAARPRAQRRRRGQPACDARLPRAAARRSLPGLLLRRSYHWSTPSAPRSGSTAEKERRVQILGSAPRCTCTPPYVACAARRRADRRARRPRHPPKLLARKEREVLDHERRLPARLRLADDEMSTPHARTCRPPPGARRQRRRRQHDARQRRRAV